VNVAVAVKALVGRGVGVAVAAEWPQKPSTNIVPGAPASVTVKAFDALKDTERSNPETFVPKFDDSATNTPSTLIQAEVTRLSPSSSPFRTSSTYGAITDAGTATVASNTSFGPGLLTNLSGPQNIAHVRACGCDESSHGPLWTSSQRP
jgi:hypothetical protein